MHLITSIEQLENLYQPPASTSLEKEVTSLNPVYRRWIEQSPFFALASSGSQGLDCSPRGDVKGELFQIIDDQTLAIPDRRGNNRIDTLRNIVEDPRVGLLFMIPGINECLRVNGKARLTTDPQWTTNFEMNGKRPTCVILVTIETVYFQCARALIRSDFWNPDLFLTQDQVPTAGEMAKSGNPTFDAINYDQTLLSRQKKTLY
ncbi:pyridoxamine 5'-phosphate oxidase family protein [Sneathiella aquimaris]|uniref:pyridoxamine 5'-phosphate oxidase family protein n=1 Tax=Sneathiella aquimaris TaxID=2599305 RepID=UPI00146B9ADF|nr:pyridoxamine 5'-phosphate oxidase family protein [Sneathiella aquimaris]